MRRDIATARFPNTTPRRRLLRTIGQLRAWRPKRTALHVEVIVTADREMQFNWLSIPVHVLPRKASHQSAKWSDNALQSHHKIKA
jgi:hypothetical protein